MSSSESEYDENEDDNMSMCSMLTTEAIDSDVDREEIENVDNFDQEKLLDKNEFKHVYSESLWHSEAERLDWEKQVTEKSKLWQEKYHTPIHGEGSPFVKMRYLAPQETTWKIIAGISITLLSCAAQCMLAVGA